MTLIQLRLLSTDPFDTSVLWQLHTRHCDKTPSNTPSIHNKHQHHRNLTINKQPFLSLQRKCAARSSGFVVYVNSKQQKIVHCVAVGRPPKLSCEIIFYPSFFGIDPQMRLSLALLACAVSTVDASSLNDIEHIVVFMQVGQHIVTPTSFLVFSFLSFPLFCSNYCRITTAATSCAFRHSFPLERRADCTSAKS